jgi:hypothetical protein
MILGIERDRNGASSEIFLVGRQEGVVIRQRAVAFAKFCGRDLISNEPARCCAFAIIFRSCEMIDHSGPPTREERFILPTTFASGQVAPVDKSNIASAYVLYEELFVRYSGIHGRYQPFGVRLVLVGSGVGWLWFYVVGDIVLKRLSGEK